ncbi:MAG: hypothetical protein HC800_18545 [Phormidesmis sp. RL_2_1]|nr:hypothetical protein [Phormidesmis sp. RL_2_1]
MKRFSPFFFALMTAFSFGAVANAQQTPAITPLADPIEITGQTGGPQSSNCGNTDPTAGQIVRVTEPFASLNFEVQSEGDYTLLITGPNGFRECVFAHNYDGGNIQAPGLLNRGEYRLYVGDRKGESHPYTLSISQ